MNRLLDSNILIYAAQSEHSFLDTWLRPATARVSFSAPQPKTRFRSPNSSSTRIAPIRRRKFPAQRTKVLRILQESAHCPPVPDRQCTGTILRRATLRLRAVSIAFRSPALNLLTRSPLAFSNRGSSCFVESVIKTESRGSFCAASRRVAIFFTQAIE